MRTDLPELPGKHENWQTIIVIAGAVTAILGLYMHVRDTSKKNRGSLFS